MDNIAKKLLHFLRFECNLTIYSISKRMNLAYTTISLIKTDKIKDIKFTHLMNLLTSLKQDNMNIEFNKIIKFIESLGEYEIKYTTDKNISEY